MTRIRDARGARVTHQRDLPTILQGLDDLARPLPLVVVVAGAHLYLHAEMLEQPARVPRVLGVEDIAGIECLAHARAGIAEVSDRRGHENQ